MPLGASRHNHVRSSSVGGEGFEPPAVSRGFRGLRRKRRRKRHRGRKARAARWARTGPRGARAAGRASGALGAAEGTQGNVEASRAGALGSHGSSLTRTHALGPTEELAGAIEFVSGARHRCHRYRNRRTQPHSLDQSQGNPPAGTSLAPIAAASPMRQREPSEAAMHSRSKINPNSEFSRTRCPHVVADLRDDQHQYFPFHTSSDVVSNSTTRLPTFIRRVERRASSPGGILPTKP